MTIVGEVSDAIKIVAETVEGIQTISEAISEGKDYLIRQHPHVAIDLMKMCKEMSKSSQALAAASSIITHFRFVIGDINAEEASRFNEHLVNHKSKAETLYQTLKSMRGSCGIIEQHYLNIRENADPKGWTHLTAALGLYSDEREHDLADALQKIYDEEISYHEDVQQMAIAINEALKDVQEKLGPPGVIKPENVPIAATTLGEYAVAFSGIESRCNYNVLQLETSINSLKNAL